MAEWDFRFTEDPGGHEAGNGGESQAIEPNER